MPEHLSSDSDQGPAAEAVKLCTCPKCRFLGVHPVDWQEASNNSWKIRLRCPNCELRQDRIVPDIVVDHYDLVLERMSAEIAKTIHEITAENNENEVRKLRAALETGLITPEDF